MIHKDIIKKTTYFKTLVYHVDGKFKPFIEDINILIKIHLNLYRL